MTFYAYRIHKDGRVCKRPFLVERFTWEQIKAMAPRMHNVARLGEKPRIEPVRKKSDIAHHSFLEYCRNIWSHAKPLCSQRFNGKLTGQPKHEYALTNGYFCVGGDL